MSQTILVTGGAGFIGSHLVDQLLALGHQVIALDNLSNGSLANLQKANTSPRFKFIEGDICQPLDDIFTAHPIGSIIHLAAINSVRYSFVNPEGTRRVNVEGTQNLVQIAAKYQVNRFIFSSSSSIYGEQETMPLHEELRPNPISPYGQQKLEAEQAVLGLWSEHQIPSYSLRFFNVFGERQKGTGEYAAFIPKSIHKILTGKPVTIFGTGEHKRDFTYVGNIVAGTLKALACDNTDSFGEAFNIGSGNPRSVNEVMASLRQLHGKEINRVDLPPIKEPARSEANIIKAGHYLNYQPQWTFEVGLSQIWNYFTAQCTPVSR